MGHPFLRQCDRPGHAHWKRFRSNLFDHPSEKSACLRESRSWLERVEHLSNLRDFSVEQFLDSIEYSRTDFFKECASNEGPGIQTLRKVADFFEISVDDLIDDRIDSDWVRAPSLREEFQAKDGSRLRTSLAVLNWIQKNHGKGPALSLVRSLRIPQASLKNPDTTVKLRLLCNLLRNARSRGVSEQGIFQMGLGAMDIPENRGIHEELSKLERPRALYDRFVNETVVKFETNYKYAIDKTTSNSITMRIRPNEERILENGAHVVSDHTLSIYRWGVAAGLLKALNLPSAIAEPIKLGTAESPDEVIRLTWETSQAAIALSSRRKSPSSLISV